MCVKVVVELQIFEFESEFGKQTLLRGAEREEEPLATTTKRITTGKCRGRRGMSARLRLNAPWLENCVRQDCDISHSE